METSNWDKTKVLQMARSRQIGYSGSTLCSNYRNPLERCETAAQAIRLYKNCISWALLERYPSKEELLSFADKSVLAENGIYIDMKFDGVRIDNHIVCVFIGCKGLISVGLNREKQIIPKLYLSEGSNLEVAVDSDLVFGIDAELYYGSKINGENIYVRDYTSQTKADNVGFTEEELSIDPDMDNEDL